MFKPKTKVLKIIHLIQELDFHEKSQLIALYFLPPAALFGLFSVYFILQFYQNKNKITQPERNSNGKIKLNKIN